MKKKFKVIGKFRGLICEPEICEIDSEECNDKETLKSSLRMAAGIDQLVSYEEIYEAEA